MKHNIVRINKIVLNNFKNVKKGMNIVLKNVIPGMEVEVHNFGEQLLDNGDTGYKIELLSKRGDISIPLKYEFDRYGRCVYS